jgi:hypothetical protein
MIKDRGWLSVKVRLFLGLDFMGPICGVNPIEHVFAALARMVGELRRATGQTVAVLRLIVLALCSTIKRLSYREILRVKHCCCSRPLGYRKCTVRVNSVSRLLPSPNGRHQLQCPIDPKANGFGNYVQLGERKPA